MEQILQLSYLTSRSTSINSEKTLEYEYKEVILTILLVLLKKQWEQFKCLSTQRMDEIIIYYDDGILYISKNKI